MEAPGIESGAVSDYSGLQDSQVEVGPVPDTVKPATSHDVASPIDHVDADGDGPILAALAVAAGAGDVATVATLSKILVLRAEERRTARLEADGVPTLARRR